MKANNTIHINGKLYDARTGELVEGSSSKKALTGQTTPISKAQTVNTPVSKSTHLVNEKRGNGFVDGIAANPKAPAKSISKSSTVKKPQSKPAKLKSRVSHTVAPVHRKMKHSDTLNRSGVKAPHLTSEESKNHNSAQRKTSRPPLRRLERAQSTKKSEIISRFSHPNAIINSHSPTIASKPREVKLSMKNVASAAEKTRLTKTSNHRSHKLIQESLSVDHSPIKKVKTPRVKRSPKIFHFMSAGLATVVLLGYVTYLNVPSVSMKVASSRAGFAATLPGQTPAGYKMQGPIGYSPGQVVINFGSNTDDRHFSIQQQPSSWDSEALKENFVAKESIAEPLTYNDRGLTIYLYNGGDAAWVDSGNFYSIKAENSQLDTSQVLDLATSM